MAQGLNRTAQKITVIAPFFNEAEGANAFYQALTRQLVNLGCPYDLVFVDDGSQDETGEVLFEIAQRDEKVSVVSLARNFGHQAALTAGLDFATGDIVVTMDSDLQHPPELIPQMLTAYENGADIVYAVRRQTAHLGPLKRLTASGYYRLLKHLASIEVLPGAADFRLMSRAAAEALRSMRETHRYLRGMVPWLGFSAVTLTFDQPDRFAGEPKYTFRKSLRLAKDGLFSFTTIPLEFITWLGIGLTLLAGLYLAYIIYVVVAGQPVEGWASVIVALLVIGGVQLISIGILAQYVGMIFEQVKGRPLYVVKQQRLSTALQHAQDISDDEP